MTYDGSDSEAACITLEGLEEMWLMYVFPEGYKRTAVKGCHGSVNQPVLLIFRRFVQETFEGTLGEHYSPDQNTNVG